MVKPGKYEATLVTPNSKTIAIEFEILPDPRVIESGVTQADMEKQLDLQLKVRDKMSEVLKLQDKLERELETLEKAKTLTDLDKNRKNVIEGTLSQIKSKEGIYEKPMLAAQWRYLYSMINQADQVPGKDAYDRYEELNTILERIQSNLD